MEGHNALLRKSFAIQCSGYYIKIPGYLQMPGVDLQTNKHEYPIFNCKLFVKITSLEFFAYTVHMCVCVSLPQAIKYFM